MHASVRAKGDQGNGTYVNPVLAGDYADPRERMGTGFGLL